MEFAEAEIGAIKRFRKWPICTHGSQVVATPRSDDPEDSSDRTQYFRNRRSRSFAHLTHIFVRGITGHAEEDLPAFLTAVSTVRRTAD